MKALRLGVGCKADSTCTQGRAEDPQGLGEATLEKIEVLERHEKLAPTLREMYSEEMRNPPGDTIVAVCDWSAPIVLQGFRSTAQEFFDKACAPLIGAWISYRGLGNCVAQKYLHAYGEINAKNPKNAKWCVVAVNYLMSEAIKCYGGTPDVVSVWFDTAQHFRNKCLLYEIPRYLFSMSVEKVRINFHAEHHGKTALDATFRRAKDWVNMHVDFAEVKKLTLTPEDALKFAYEAASPTSSEYLPLFLPAVPYAGPMREFRLTRIRAIHHFESYIKGGYKITNASGRDVVRASILTGPVSFPDDDDASSHVLVTKHERASYVPMVRKKFLA